MPNQWENMIYGQDIAAIEEPGIKQFYDRTATIQPEREAAMTQGVIPYYPQGYKKENLAPEHYSKSSIRGLAQVFARMGYDGKHSAVTKNPALFLANALVEGPERGLVTTWIDMENRYPWLKLQVKERMKGKVGPPQQELYPGVGDYGVNHPTPEVEHSLAEYLKSGYLGNVGAMKYGLMLADKTGNYATSVLGEKAPVKKRLGLWNGVGKGARNHVRKVTDLAAALRLPENKAIWDEFQKYSKPEVWGFNDPNKPTAAQAVKKAAPTMLKQFASAF